MSTLVATIPVCLDILLDSSLDTRRPEPSSPSVILAPQPPWFPPQAQDFDYAPSAAAIKVPIPLRLRDLNQTSLAFWEMIEERRKEKPISLGEMRRRLDLPNKRSRPGDKSSSQRQQTPLRGSRAEGNQRKKTASRQGRSRGSKR